MTPLNPGLLTVGVLSLLLLGTAQLPHPVLHQPPPTATVIFETPDSGTATRTVVVELPLTSSTAAPVLAIRHVDPTYVVDASHLERVGHLPSNSALVGRQLIAAPALATSQDLPSQDLPSHDQPTTPPWLVLLAVGVLLALLRRVVLLVSDASVSWPSRGCGPRRRNRAR